MLKKLRRKRIRQKKAQERDKKIEEEESEKLKDPKYVEWLKELETIEKSKQEMEEIKHKLEEKKWFEREKQAQIQFRYEKERNQRIEEIKRIEREKIQKEFEEMEKIEKQKKKEKKKREKQALRKQRNLIKKLYEYSEGRCEMPFELKTNFESNPGKELCPFFTKTGVCRHGHLCSKNHIKPGISRIVLLHNFFQHIQLNEIKRTEYGNDMQLEFSEYELYKDYSIFFNDICYELEKFGKIINIRTAKNSLQHLKGNVYVEYNTERSAMKAYLNLQGRFYACKQINAEFCTLVSWKSAVCGLSFSNNCAKGKICNYLHIFKNPGDKYNKPLKHNDLTENRIENQLEFSNKSWNEIDSKDDTRNWRWSESPDKDFIESHKNENKKEDNVQSTLTPSETNDRFKNSNSTANDSTESRKRSLKRKTHSKKEHKRSKSKRSSSRSKKKRRKKSIERERTKHLGHKKSHKHKRSRSRSRSKSNRESRSRN